MTKQIKTIINNSDRGVIYYRVSTSEQAEHGFSLERQRELCLNHAKAKGIEVISEFHDDGESAKTANRKGLQDMLKYCADRKNNIGHVIFYKIDRLTRNVDDHVFVKTVLKKAGVKLTSVTESMDNETPAGKFTENMLAAVAQFDNDVRSERTRGGMYGCLKTGRWPFRAPIGYLNHIDSDKKKSIALDPKRANLVKTIFTEYANPIVTQEEVRRKVNNLGLRDAHGRQIRPQFINKILQDRFYIGTMTVKGVDYPGTHDKLVDEETFELCQRKLRYYDRGDHIAIGRYDEDFPLRHFVVCEDCRRPLTAAYSTGRWGKKFPYYRCYNKQCPSHKSYPKQLLEEEFANYLKEIVPTEEQMETYRMHVLDIWQTKFKEINTHRERLERELKSAREEKEGIIEMKAKKQINDEEFQVMFTKARIKVDDLQITFGQTDLEEYDLDEAIKHSIAFAAQLASYWEKSPYFQRLSIQGLIFRQKPTYGDSKFGTPKLPLMFEQKQISVQGKSAIVDRIGFEPMASSMPWKRSSQLS